MPFQVNQVKGNYDDDDNVENGMKDWCSLIKNIEDKHEDVDKDDAGPEGETLVWWDDVFTENDQLIISLSCMRILVFCLILLIVTPK